MRAPSTTVRQAQPGDIDALTSMRRALWPDGTVAEHRGELEAFFAGRAREPLAVLVAEGPG
ncbi:MAG: AAC(6')-I family aminoglycoside N-acetyltransferase, partial [Acidobacteriota bacterium]